MSISEERDALLERPSPDRVFYSTGVLLDAEDFKAEQNYHRGRLARVLAYLHGGGTVVGLRVPPVEPVEDPEQEEVRVEPGIAIDRLGRIVEVPRRACIRINRWFAAQDASALRTGVHGGAVVVDVFVRFVACERGKTPHFATGPFDALDAVTASRLRDGYQLELQIRPEDPQPVPENPWPDLAAIADPGERRAALREAILDGWRENGALQPLPEHAPGQGVTAVFLARLRIPATETTPPVRTGDPITVDDSGRLFIYTTGAIARWVGI
jgi:hypothetical protein